MKIQETKQELETGVIDEREHKEKTFQQQINNILTSPKLSEEHRRALQEYYNAILISDSRFKMKSKQSLLSALLPLKFLGEYVKKPYNLINEQDVKNWFHHLVFGKQLSKQTITYYGLRIKQFYKWLYDTDECPKLVKWIGKYRPQKKELVENELLNLEDIKKLIDACDNDRDKAFVITLYESAARISELLFSKIKDLTFDEYGAKITLDGKTGKRTLRLIDSVPYLQKLVNNHPYKHISDCHLFVYTSGKFSGRAIGKIKAREVLQTASKTARLNKYVHPHLFRHSRLNHLAKLSFNERDLRIFAGWSSSSDMPNTYLHYQEEQVENKLLENRGIIKTEQKFEIKLLEPKICPRCGKQNCADALYCNCGLALDLKTVMQDTERREKADTVMNELFQDDEFKKIVKKFLEKKKPK